MNQRYQLSDLLKGIAEIDRQLDCKVVSLVSDSRKVTKESCFIALSGGKTDGNRFIDDAISKGAVAVLTDDKNAPTQSSTPVIFIPELQAQLGDLAARFYGHPSADMEMIGITGTNGKTSCSHYIASALTAVDRTCGIMGTLGHGFSSELHRDAFTTPDPISLQRTLAELKSQGAAAVAMEVSSHGLAQHRVQGVEFDVAVFTNLSRDHLDYHGNMADYAAAKRRLFTWPGLKKAVINLDDEYGQRLMGELQSGSLKLLGYSLSDQKQKFPAIGVKRLIAKELGWDVQVTTPWGDGRFSSPLMGRFNVSNVLAVLGVLCSIGVPFDRVLKVLPTLKAASGRMHVAGGGKKPLVIVDYAHTPDALKQALQAVREHCSGELWCVFGCGGDRDAGKRAKMGEVAERFSDQIVITDDNPREEDPAKITDQIVTGLLCPWAAEIEHDRHAAIAHAISMAKAGDAVLIAGRGGELFQKIAGKEIPFNDIEQAEVQLSCLQE